MKPRTRKQKNGRSIENLGVQKLPHGLVQHYITKIGSLTFCYGVFIPHPPETEKDINPPKNTES